MYVRCNRQRFKIENSSRGEKVVVEFLGLADILRLVSTLWGLTGRRAVAGLETGWGVTASVVLGVPLAYYQRRLSDFLVRSRPVLNADAFTSLDAFHK